MGITISRATIDDFDEVQVFYKKTGYTPNISKDDIILVARGSNVIIGVAKICRENDILVLRGMKVDEKKQRLGIGSLLLNGLNEIMGERECFCLPFDHLLKFYGRIGFQKIDPSDAPIHLRERLLKYKETYPNIIIMKRSGRKTTYSTPT